MDFTSAQFGCHAPFTETPTFGELYFPRDQSIPLDSHLGPFATHHTFINLSPPDSQSFHSYTAQQSRGFSYQPPLGTETLATHAGFKDPSTLDPDVYPLFLNLTLTDGDLYELLRAPASPSSAVNYLATTEQSPRDLPPATPPPSLINCGSQATQDDTEQHGVFRTRARVFRETRPQRVRAPSMDILDDGRCICIWKDDQEGVCGFMSNSLHLVKRHVKRAHLRIR